MRARRCALLFLWAAFAPGAARAQSVTIEKAVVPWSELERLLRSQGEAVERPRAGAPRPYSLSSVEVTGDVFAGRARLTVSAEVQLLDSGWTTVPLFPPRFEVARARIDKGPGQSAGGHLVRDELGVLFVAQRPGTYRVEAELGCELERDKEGWYLTWTPPALVGGAARLRLLGVEAERAASWSLTTTGQEQHLSALLGSKGLQLRLRPTAGGASKRPEKAPALELEATTVLSLGGSGMTRLVLRESPPSLELPPGARVWRAFQGPRARRDLEGARGRVLLPEGEEVELFYTFETHPLGVRGRLRVELPRLPSAVRGARWDAWLPSGLTYRDVQASLARSAGCVAGNVGPARAPLELQGECHGFAQTMLERPGYVEAAYQQRF